MSVQTREISGRVTLDFLRRFAEREHQRLGAIGRADPSGPRLLLGFELHSAVRINLIEQSGKLSDGGLVREPLDLVALEGVGQRLIEARL